MATVKITAKNYDEVVLNTEKTVLLDFYADWCGPCKMLAPILEGISEESDALIGKINVDDELALARKFGITAIPTLIVIKNGEVKNKQMGFMSKSELLEMLSK